jgi:hypothetical protein
MAVGAGGAITVGLNRFPPVGLMVFSVGDTGGGGAVVVVVVVVVVEGSWVLWLPQAAVNAPIAIIAATPAAAGRRRVKRPDLMMQSYLYPAIMRFATRDRRSRTCAACTSPGTNERR